MNKYRLNSYDTKYQNEMFDLMKREIEFGIGMCAPVEADGSDVLAKSSYFPLEEDAMIRVSVGNINKYYMHHTLYSRYLVYTMGFDAAMDRLQAEAKNRLRRYIDNLDQYDITHEPISVRVARRAVERRAA